MKYNKYLQTMVDSTISAPFTYYLPESDQSDRTMIAIAMCESAQSVIVFTNESTTNEHIQ